MKTLIHASLWLLVTSTMAGCASAMAHNKDTDEIYIIKGNKLKVCTLSGGTKIECPKSYIIPR